MSKELPTQPASKEDSQLTIDVVTTYDSGSLQVEILHCGDPMSFDNVQAWGKFNDIDLRLVCKICKQEISLNFEGEGRD